MASSTGRLWTSIGRKYLMALSGLLLGLFLLVHLLGNSFMFRGAAAFNAYADRLHALGGLLWVFHAGLFVLFGLHIVTSTILFFENRRARTKRYAAPPKVAAANWGARSMPYSGLVILVFLFVHLSNFSLGKGSLAESQLVASILSRMGYALFYIAGLAGLTLHISHGFWSLFQTLGINHPRYNRSIERWTLVVALGAGAIFIVIPVLFLLDRGFLR